MFGFSFGELMVICIVALVAVGPKRLPSLLGTLGQWIRKLRNMVHDMRAQSGIDEILRAEGLQGGINELRSLMRVQHTQFFQPDPPQPPRPAPSSDVGTPEVESGAAAPPPVAGLTPAEDP
ncbi:MAG TPA: Sec-independent protein translocase protein TatB, partial [Polyangiaceae bacterium]|nr:Sec-independent protein translocase protein TatB [Polyangiaceae bacterium]